jgi:hypothetical protein
MMTFLIKTLLPSALFLALTVSSVQASSFDIRAGGDRFEDCELLEVGPRGAVSGTMALSELVSGGKWASVLAFILIDDAKFQTSFRFALSSVIASQKLESQYEFFVGSRRPVAEALTEVAPGSAMPFRFSWNETGLVELSAGSSQARRLMLDFKPTRAFVLVSGGRGRLELEGTRGIDCSRDLALPTK